MTDLLADLNLNQQQWKLAMCRFWFFDQVQQYNNMRQEHNIKFILKRYSHHLARAENTYWIIIQMLDWFRATILIIGVDEESIE